MSELGDLLEVLNPPGPRFKTLRARGFEWRHHQRLGEAFVRGAPKGTRIATVTAVNDQVKQDEAIEDWRLWMETPDRMRVEFMVGGQLVTAAFSGDTWWSYSPYHGFQTNRGVQTFGHGKGPGEAIVDPAPLLGLLSFQLEKRDTFLSREVFCVRGEPRGSGDPSHRLCLHAIGSGADEYSLTVDAERGLLLRIEARLNGEPFRTVEVTELGIDEALGDDIFMLRPPEA